MNPVRKAQALAALLVQLLVVACPHTAGPARAAARTAEGAPPRPAILVHGLGGSKEKTFGWQKQRSFYRWLIDAGYEEGATLFAFDYSSRPSGDYVEISRDLAGFVEQVRRLTGSPSVDIIAHSMGCLVSRKYLDEPRYADDVQNLVMISPPNHGSFAASAAALERQVLYHEGLSLGAKGKAPEGRQEFVASRARDTYEPLYAEFARQRTWGPAGLGTSGQTFEEWIACSKADVYSRLIGPAPAQAGPAAGPAAGHVAVPCEPARLSSSPADVSPEDGLTGSYYEYVALNVGRNNYLRKKEAPSSLIRLVTPAPKGGWSLPLALVREVLMRLADPLIKRLVTGLKGLLFKAPAQLFGIDVEEPAILRMVEERLKFSSGRSGGRVLYDALPANWYLARLNERVESARGRPAPEGTRPRYLIYAAKSANIAGAIWKTVDANDIAVELESSYITPQADDVYGVSSGATLFHGALLSQPRLVSEIVTELAGRKPDIELEPEWREGPRMVSWSNSGNLAISDWRPRYICVSSEKTHAPCDLEVKLARGGRYATWVDIKKASGETDRFRLGGMDEFSVSRFGEEVLEVTIGLRVETDDRTHLREQKGTVDYTVKAVATGTAVAQPVQAGNSQSRQPGKQAASEQVDAGTTWPSLAATNRRAAQAEAGWEGAAWEWDFGDGTPADPPGAGGHVFAEAGRHTIIATAKDSAGLIVERHQWSVETSKPSETVDLDPAGDAAFAPRPVIRIIAPKKWITGKPATIEVSVEPPDEAVIEVVSVEPGRRFQVTWNKPGLFPVRVTVKVRSLTGPGKSGTWRTDTYVRSVTVDVLAPGSTG
ncbi:MAG: alpha/beta fold hydrolase [Bacillota bacterium]|nr:alpha/beta fold hydrolase [Bacillota bacterium]